MTEDANAAYIYRLISSPELETKATHMSKTRSVLSELSHRNRWSQTLDDALVDCQWKMSWKMFQLWNR